MDDLIRSLRFATRSLLRHRTLSLLAVVCMGLGIGTCVTLFTTLNPWLYRPLPYPAAGRLMNLRETLPEGGGQWSGRTLRLDGQLYSIVGVMPERFNFPEYAEVWTPLGLETGGKRDERRLEVIACLRRDTPPAKA